MLTAADRLVMNGVVWDESCRVLIRQHEPAGSAAAAGSGMGRNQQSSGRLVRGNLQGNGSAGRGRTRLAEGSGVGSEGRRSGESRILALTYRLITANLWLRTAILAGVSVGLIVLAFDWHVTTRPGILAFLAAQLGTGLLVGAVGAALVQGFIMSAPETWRKLVRDLRSDRDKDAQDRVSGQLAVLENTTAEGLRGIEAQLSGLTAEMQAHDRRSRAATDEALDRAGVAGFYPVSDEANADITAAMGDPGVAEIRLLGVSLNDWFSDRNSTKGTVPPGRLLERMLLGQGPARARRKPLSVRVMLLDPGCAAARLLTYGTDAQEREERTERLRNEVLEVADHLRWLRGRVNDKGNGSSLQVRFYRTAPAFFICSTQAGSFIRPYYAGLSSRPAPAPVWHYRGTSAAHAAVHKHFRRDLAWQLTRYQRAPGPAIHRPGPGGGRGRDLQYLHRSSRCPAADRVAHPQRQEAGLDTRSFPDPPSQPPS